MFLGITIGALFKKDILIIEPIRKIFVSLIKMVVLPLIIASLISSLTSLNSSKQLKKIGAKTIGLLLFTTGIATVIGILVGNMMNLGSGVMLVKDVSFKVSDVPSFSKVILDMIP